MSDEINIDFEPAIPRTKTPEDGKIRVRRQLIPELPPLEVDPEKLSNPDQRASACVNMKLAGAGFHDIAKELGYADAQAAKTAYIAALARMNPVEDWETLRQTEALRAEQQLARSIAMASADYLIVHKIVKDEEGKEYEVIEHVPNLDKLRWHEQAGKDLALHATITGAKAPARVEVTADTQELNQMVQVLMQAKQGQQGELEAEIWDVEEVPDEAEGMGD